MLYSIVVCNIFPYYCIEQHIHRFIYIYIYNMYLSVDQMVTTPETIPLIMGCMKKLNGGNSIACLWKIIVALYKRKNQC